MSRITVIGLGKFDITSSPWARNSGVVFDQEMSMIQQVTQACRAAYWHLHSTSTIRSTIVQEAAAKLAASLVLSRLDFGNVF